MNEIWEVSKRTQKDIVDQLLVNRGVGLDKDSKQKFFNPKYEDLNDPYLLIGMEKAVSRIRDAFEKKETVGIFADYDADGIPGAAILFRSFSKIGIKSKVYIPDREEGYGLSKKGIDCLVSLGCTLIITVDLGIKNFNEASYCKENKIDLIITDHHLPDEKTPDAFAVINPKLSKKYPDPNLCGCAVAYKLITALNKHFSRALSEPFLKWSLDLVSISTISDVVPLTGENRVLAKYGLIVLNKTKNAGLRALIGVSQIKREKIDAYVAGFQIGPRLNAPGRIDHATKSFELLVTEDSDEASRLARWLNRQNENRQKEMDTVIKQAIAKINEEKQESNHLIVIAGEWIKGIIGPSASRIADTFTRPVILFSSLGGVFTGSARSVEGVNIVDLISTAGNYVERFGGHKGAAGLTVSLSNFEKFKKIIQAKANRLISKDNLTKRIKIDLEIRPEEITYELCDRIACFEPFGLGNPTPVFLISGSRIIDMNMVGRDKNHLSMTVRHGKSNFRAIKFQHENPNVMINEKYDLAVKLCPNEWGNKKRVDLNIVGMRKVEE